MTSSSPVTMDSKWIVFYNRMYLGDTAHRYFSLNNSLSPHNIPTQLTRSPKISNQPPLTTQSSTPNRNVIPHPLFTSQTATNTLHTQSATSFHSNHKRTRLKSINQAQTAKRPCLSVLQCKQNQEEIENKIGAREEDCLKASWLIPSRRKSGSEKLFLEASLMSTTEFGGQTQPHPKTRRKSGAVSDKFFKLFEFKMTQSNFFNYSSQNLRVEESIMQERSTLEHFLMVRKVAPDEYISIEKSIGYCLVIKILPLEDLPNLYLETKTRVKVEHPNILKDYSMVVDNCTCLILKEYYSEELHDCLNTYSPSTVSSFIKQIIILLEHLCSKNICFNEDIYLHLVVSHSLCKVNNLSCSESLFPESSAFKSIIRMVESLRIAITHQEYMIQLGRLLEYVRGCRRFDQVKSYPLFVQ